MKTNEFITDKYAVIETGGKQYRVSEGLILTVEKLPGEYKEGDKITFDQVLLTDNGSKTEVGAPTVAGAKVEAKFVDGGRGKKTLVMRYQSKSRHFIKKGHRQPFSTVQITKI